MFLSNTSIKPRNARNFSLPYHHQTDDNTKVRWKHTHAQETREERKKWEKTRKNIIKLSMDGWTFVRFFRGTKWTKLRIYTQMNTCSGEWRFIYFAKAKDSIFLQTKVSIANWKSWGVDDKSSAWKIHMKIKFRTNRRKKRKTATKIPSFFVSVWVWVCMPLFFFISVRWNVFEWLFLVDSLIRIPLYSVDW